MKRISLMLLLVVAAISLKAQTASKVIYSNALTHCYVTAIAINDSTVNYCISEKSERNIWRFTDREETQSLGLFDKETTIAIFRTAIQLYDDDELEKDIEVCKNVHLVFVKIMGIKCAQLNNSLVGTSFNINRKTAEDVLMILAE